MRFVVQGCRLAAAACTVLACAAATPPAPLPAARTAPADDEIRDAQAHWHFARIDGVYSVEGRSLVCVQKADGQWDYWDPRRDALLGTKNLSCLPPMGTRVEDISVALAPPPGAAYTLDTRASFSGGTAIHRETGGFVHCDSAFSHPYTVALPHDEPYSFYVITRLRHPRDVDLSLTACGVDPGVVTVHYTQAYDDVADLQALDLGDHRTLLMAATDDAEPVVLVLHDRPQHVWSGSAGVWFVPAALLRPALDKAGSDFAARETAVERVIFAGH
jgi:hypothetical protein